MKSKFTIIVAIVMMALFSTTAMGVGTFEILPFGDSFFPSTMSLSFDGSAVAGWGNNYWTPETGWLVIDGGQIAKITGSGQMIIGTTTNPADGLQWAATYNPNTTVWTLMDLLPGGEGCSDWGSGYAGNFDGDVATGLAWVPTCKAEAFKWTMGAGTVGLGRPTADRSSRGTDISDDGTMVVGFAEHPTQGHRRPAYWTDDVVGPQLLADEDVVGEFLAVNSFGTVACGTMNNEQFYWDPTNGAIPIGSLPGETQGSIALDVSDDGKVVGYSGNPFSTPAATIWTLENGLQPIGEYFAEFDVPTPAGFYYYSCTGVSADGMTFVGAGIVEGGFLNSPWLVRLDDSVVPVFLGYFDVEISNNSVELSFDVNSEAVSSDFVMVAEFQGREYTVPVIRQGSTFVANDDSPELRQGGTAVYSLYLVEDGERTLISSKSVDLDRLPELVSQLKGAYPNPFNPMTKVAFSMAETGHVELAIYDASGRRVAQLASESYGAGDHTVTWYGKDDNGRSLASGTYFVQMKTGSIIQQQKVNLVK